MKFFPHVIAINIPSAIKMADTGSQVPSTPELNTSENAPLLQEEHLNEPPPAFNQGYNTQGNKLKRLKHCPSP